MEHLGVFFRQYFYAMDREEMPFNRAQRSWVYRAAKNLDNTQPFGSTRDLRPTGTLLFANATFPALETAAETLPLVIGPECAQPYRGRQLLQYLGNELRRDFQAGGAGALKRGAAGRLLDEHRRGRFVAVSSGGRR
jgi:hypothetical protein